MEKEKIKERVIEKVGKKYRLFSIQRMVEFVIDATLEEVRKSKSK